MSLQWKPVKWERTTVDEDAIERQRQRDLWKRLEAASKADHSDEQYDEDELANDVEDSSEGQESQ
jgi:hypothetical protein